MRIWRCCRASIRTGRHGDAWILAAALATIAGTLYGLDKSFKPFTYLQLLLPIFAAAIVGGIGQPSAPWSAASSSPSPR
jgi:branched-subunit amino acid ABC-type transport system permease component